MKNQHMKSVALFLIMLIACTALSISCEEEMAACELENTGELVVENTSPTATLHLFFNNSRPSINGSGDLVVEAGAVGMAALPAGQHNIKAAKRVTSCNGGRCSTTSSGQPEKNITLRSCEAFNLVY